MSIHQAVQDLQAYLDNYAISKSIKILEAGSGSSSHVTFHGDSCTFGIDISERQLNQNQGLDSKIKGDIQYRNFASSSFHIIICWDVLEHLQRPDLALENFSEMIKKNGLIILSLPNVLSLKGLITKISPFFIHEFFYKKLFGKTNDASHGHGPFPTFLKFSISPNAIRKFADKRELQVVFFRFYEPMAKYLRKRNKYVYFIYQLSTLTLKILSLGKLCSSDFLIVLRRI